MTNPLLFPAEHEITCECALCAEYQTKRLFYEEQATFWAEKAVSLLRKGNILYAERAIKNSQHFISLAIGEIA